MNILYVMRYWPVYGGGETITVTLANEFVKRGHSVYVVYTYDKSCNPMPYSISPAINSQKMHTIEKYCASDVEKLQSYVVDNGIDVIINQWGSTKLCRLAIRQTKCKLITCWHLDVLPKVRAPHDIKEKIVNAIFRKRVYVRYVHWRQMRDHNLNYKLSDKYVFLSHSFLREYVSLTHLKPDKEKLGAIPNPLTYTYDYDFNDYGKKKKQVLFVGRIFEYHKRLSYILRIWKQIEIDGRYSDWKLVIVGDGPDMHQTKQFSTELGLEQISFEGFRDPRQYYLESALFMMTSAFEGFGMTLVEAQQYGTVPIAMDSYKSLHDILQDKVNGIVVPDNDIDCFVKELKQLMDDKEKRKQLAMKGSETCRRFSVDSIATQWESFFKTLIDGK